MMDGGERSYPASPFANLFAPVFAFFRGKRELDRIGAHDFEIGTALTARHDFANFNAFDFDFGVTLGAICNCSHD